MCNNCVDQIFQRSENGTKWRMCKMYYCRLYGVSVILKFMLLIRGYELFMSRRYKNVIKFYGSR